MQRGYIYQTIHTVGYTPLYLDEHCTLMEQAFIELFFRPIYLDREAIALQIDQLLREGGLTSELSIFVELRLFMDGEHELSVDHISIYEGYTLRCFTPRIVQVEFSSPFGLLPTSARRGALALAGEMAINLGGDLAIEYRDQELISVGGAAIFMVVGRRVITPLEFESVEREVVCRAVERCALELELRSISLGELLSCDELFIADHYGVSAVAQFEHRSYANDIAIKVADSMAQPF